jgi:hypothetical protein
MLTSEAHVDTERASRYLIQVCRHFSHLRRHESRPDQNPAHARPDVQAQVEWSATHGTISFGWGRCTMQANPGTLTLRAEAPDEDNLERVQDLLADHVERFGSRDHLKVKWTPPQDGGEQRPTPSTRDEDND